MAECGKFKLGRRANPLLFKTERNQRVIPRLIYPYAFSRLSFVLPPTIDCMQCANITRLFISLMKHYPEKNQGLNTAYLAESTVMNIYAAAPIQRDSKPRSSLNHSLAKIYQEGLHKITFGLSTLKNITFSHCRCISGWS